MPGIVEVDRASRALGVATDAGIGDAVQAFHTRADRLADEVALLWRVVGYGVSPDTEDALGQAVDYLAEAGRALDAVRAATAEHVRGGR